MHRLAEIHDLRPVYTIYMDEKVVQFLGFDAMPVEAFLPIFENRGQGTIK